MRFNHFVESAVDKFGFSRPKPDPSVVERETKPVKQFDTEYLIQLLSRERIGVNEAKTFYPNEVTWGDQYGSVRLEVSPKLILMISRLTTDLEGNRRWIAKKAFQLDRSGRGGVEESVAAELMEEITRISEGNIDAPVIEFDSLVPLVEYIAERLKQTASSRFVYRSIKKVTDENYLIIFDTTGGGVGAPDQQRVEENLTDVHFDRTSGTLHIRNYMVTSKNGASREWIPRPAHLNLYFMPTQSFSEIADPFIVLLKHF